MRARLEPDMEHYLKHPFQTYTRAYAHRDAKMSEEATRMQTHALQCANSDKPDPDTRAVQDSPPFRKTEGRL